MSFENKRHSITSRDLVKASLPNYRHGWTIAGALAKFWAMILGLRMEP
jgi:hypothetical protein